MVFPVVGGDGKPTGYEIDNSLRFNRGDNPNLEKTFSGSPTSTTKCTISFWTKLANPSDTNAKNIFSAIKSGSNEDCIKFMGVNNGILNNLEFVFNNTSAGSMMVSNGTSSFVKFRDSTAWYHFVIAIDSEQGTASNRVKVYVNGTQRDVELRIDGGSQTTDVPLTQNYDLGFLTASKHQIGMNVESANSEPFDGYLSEFYFIDGQQLAPTEFAETNDNGVWIPKAYEGTYGNFGFFLEFQDSGNLGDDTSGNTNDFTATNLTATDVTTDTPTNNFCTLNPLAPINGGAPSTLPTFSEGNTQITVGDGTARFAVGTFATSMPYYFEVKVSAISASDSGQRIGILDEEAISSSTTYNSVYQGGGTITATGESNATGKDTLTANDIIGVAVDLGTNNNIKFYENGDLQATMSVGASYQGLNSTPFARLINATTTFQFNFGNAPFTISSGNADANGYGNFEYAVPSGYYALCTKNLAEYG